jgi:hypothetical protein
MKISIRHDLDELVRHRRDDARRIKLAAAKALTFTAERAKAELEREMARVFDRPTPYTMRSLRMRSATPARLEAWVWFKDEAFKGTPATRYLAPQVYGGPRPMKRMEQALRSAGALPAGYFVVPGGGAKLDGFGNIARSQVVQVLSQLRAQRGGGYESRISADSKRRARAIKRAGGAFFVGRPGGGRLPLGVWQSKRFAHGSAVVPILIYVRQPQYRKLLDFFAIGQRVAAREFPRLFEAAVAREFARK